MKHEILKMITGLLCGLSFSVPTVGQEGVPELVYYDSTIEGLFWTSNGQDLLFQTLASDATSTIDRVWATLDTVTDQIDISVALPVPSTGQLSLDTQAQIILQNATATFPSPNGTYLVAAGDIDADTFSTETVIADLQTNTEISILLRGIGAAQNFERYNIQWSGNSEVFVVSASGRSSGPYYFYHVDLSDGINTPVVNAFSQSTLKMSPIPPVKFMTWHQYRSNVLLQSDYTLPGSSSNINALFIWNSEGEHQVIYLNDLSIGDVLTGSFAFDDENALQLVTDIGLVQIDIHSPTEQPIVINPEINTERYSDAQFSPGGERLALVAPVPGNQLNVYILDLTQ